MMKKRMLIPVVVIVLLSFPLLSADLDSGWPCVDDAGCEADLGNGEQYYCGMATNTCFQIEGASSPATAPASTAPAATSPTPATAVEADVEVLKLDVQTLDQGLSSVQQDVSLVKDELASVQRQLGRVSTDVSTLSQSLNTEVTPKVSQALAGQAVLQEGLNQTNTELGQLQEGLEKEQSFSRFLKLTFFTLLVVAIALGVIYYLNRGGRESSASAPSDIMDYITTQIARGKKLPVIKQSLAKRGWSDEEIVQAYQQTLRRNLQKYRQGQTRGGGTTEREERAAPQYSGYDSKKIASIAIVSVILLIGIIFLISGAVGKAFFVTRFINQSSGEIVDVSTCTPPQIMSPEGTCCTDVNNNTLCDVAEREVESIEGEQCTDNLQCGSGEYCINGKCGTLAGLYKGSDDCSKLCHYYSLNVRTSDGESYTIRPGRGSYTAVGALEWRTGEMPEHCEGEAAIVPFHILRKDVGKVISEEVIALHEGEQSSAITHPTLPDVSFWLLPERIFELCEER